ncbi:hypothetical protein ACFVXE_01995 [Streptomyces sp. NPDC058231]|uniref:hypothetical protein n=1 Tax=Streptomyces sp. NPDC058231 TaxID=3346392 RepID=UPI0036E6D291
MNHHSEFPATAGPHRRGSSGERADEPGDEWGELLTLLTLLTSGLEEAGVQASRRGRLTLPGPYPSRNRRCGGLMA